MAEKKENTTAMIIASQNQDYVDEGLAEYQDQIHKLQSKSCIGYNKKSACLRLLVCCAKFLIFVSPLVMNDFIDHVKRTPSGKQ